MYSSTHLAKANIMNVCSRIKKAAVVMKHWELFPQTSSHGNVDFLFLQQRQWHGPFVRNSVDMREGDKNVSLNMLLIALLNTVRL